MALIKKTIYNKKNLQQNKQAKNKYFYFLRAWRVPNLRTLLKITAQKNFKVMKG